MDTHPTFVKAADGQPAFVVLPYLEYVQLTGAKAPGRLADVRIPADGTIPHEVVELMTGNGWSSVRAWREYLGITQTEMAARLGIRQPSYAAMEAPGARPRRATSERIAAALGVQLTQIDLR